MMLNYSLSAVADLIRLRKFIAANNPENSLRVSKDIIKSIGKIESSPLIGKRLHNFTEEIRELVIGRYIFRYLVAKNTITILNIWHGRESKEG